MASSIPQDRKEHYKHPPTAPRATLQDRPRNGLIIAHSFPNMARRCNGGWRRVGGYEKKRRGGGQEMYRAGGQILGSVYVENKYRLQDCPHTLADVSKSRIDSPAL